MSDYITLTKKCLPNTLTPDEKKIIKKADSIVRKFGVREPKRLCDELGVELLYAPFKRQKGAYKVVLRNRFIFLKDDLDPVTENTVILHELGHDALHRNLVQQGSVFGVYDIFSLQSNQMEYEANVFAARVFFDDEQFLSLCQMEYTAEQIAAETDSDVNLVCLMAQILYKMGYNLNLQSFNNKFLQ